MPAEPPKYRPLERFWPYADLPEQPSDEELAAIDPELFEALFGAEKRPFSVSLVFPRLNIPDFDRALTLARESAEETIKLARLGSKQPGQPARPLSGMAAQKSNP